MNEIVRAVHEASLRAVIVRRVPMYYRAGADAASDRPAHVRAGSSLAWWGDDLVVVQDDANFIALVNVADGSAEAIALPAGEGGARQFDVSRGNKKYKLDLEALVSVGPSEAPVLLAFGSGSKKRREQIVTFREAHSVSVQRASALYARLRETRAFAGAEMNIEGVILIGDTLRFFGRGNGAATDDDAALNATCEIALSLLLAHLQSEASPAPEPLSVRQYDLGEIDGVRLSFTDATPAWSSNVVLFTAAAEASKDAIEDGEVRGSAIGVIGERVVWAPLTDERGTTLAIKAEGLVCGDRAVRQLYVVIDSDAHDTPSELCEVRLEGPWPELDG